MIIAKWNPNTNRYGYIGSGATKLGVNELINPDFKVNQRGASSYTATGYTVDHWRMNVGNFSSVAVADDGVTLTVKQKLASSEIYGFTQNFEKAVSGTVTLSINVTELNGSGFKFRVRVIDDKGAYVKAINAVISTTGVTTVTGVIPDGARIEAFGIGFNTAANIGDTIKVAWCKVEKGGEATPFVAPDYDEELVKCQRYCQVRSVGTLDFVDMRPNMYTGTQAQSIKSMEGSNYVYQRELL